MVNHTHFGSHPKKRCLECSLNNVINVRLKTIKSCPNRKRLLSIQTTTLKWLMFSIIPSSSILPSRVKSTRTIGKHGSLLTTKNSILREDILLSMMPLKHSDQHFLDSSVSSLWEMGLMIMRNQETSFTCWRILVLSITLLCPSTPQMKREPQWLSSVVMTSFVCLNQMTL